MAESQEDSEQERQVCLKCGKVISHIPYKYYGQQFHARCLICSTCGKKLVGKPFITEGNRLFCGEQCQISYQESQVQTSVVENKAPSPTLNGDIGHNESFLEALQSTEQTASSSSSRQQPQLQPPDVHIERITDYPCHATGSPTSQSPGSTRRSSLSVSESSLTSEGSVGFDASKRPGKRILKKPHGPRKYKPNRVHWKLPEEGGDTMSLESFESSSTMSGMSYQRTRNGVMETRQNWREFERSPPPGSTGLTPAKSSRLPQESLLHANYRGDRSPSPSSPPHSPGHGSQHLSASGGEGVGAAGHGPRFGRTVSPLQYSLQMHSPSHASPSATLQTSTPLRDHSNTSPSRLRASSQTNGGGLSNSLSPPASVPLLSLDHSNLSELEASTAEDRKKSHLFEIPHLPRSLASALHFPPGPQHGQNSGPTNYSGYIPPVGMEHMCEDDADDYDHLSPLKMANTQPSPPPPPPPAKSRPKDDYGDSDIDEALDELQDSMSSQSSSAPQSPTADLSPPLSPRGQGGRAPEPHNKLPNSNLASSAPASADPRGPGELMRRKRLPPPIPPKSAEVLNVLYHEKQQQKMHESHEDKSKPPPLPPKMRKRTTPETSSSYSPPAQGLSRPPTTHATTTATSVYPHELASHQPPEFATTTAQTIDSPDHSQEEAGEDALSSISNATLVAEQEESSPNSHTTEQNTPRLKTKFDQVGGPGEGRGGEGTGRTDTQASHFSKSATRIPPTSAHVHPEVFYPPSSSSSSHQHQSWNSSTSQREEGSAGNSLPYHPQPSYYHRETHLPPINENTQLERKSVISVSNSSSDSSLRGASPPEKVSHTVVQTHSYSHSHRYSSERERMGAHVTGPGVLRHPPTITPAHPHTVTSSVSLSQPTTSTTTVSNRSHSQAPYMYNHSPPMGGSNFSNVPPGSPRKRVSMDKTYNEGSLLTRNHRLYHSQRSALTPRTRQRFLSVEGSSEVLDAPWGAKNGKQYHTIGSPKGLRLQPTNFFTSSWETAGVRRTNSPPYSFSQDDSRLLEPFYPGLPGGKLMNMKPEIHDTEGAIQRMLADVESSGSEDELQNGGKKRPYGPCAVCHKVIHGANALKIYEKVRYHSKCFKCAFCGVSLLGQKPTKIGDRLFCNDHNNLGYSHPTGLGRRQPERQPRPVQGHPSHHEPHPLTSHTHNLHPHPPHTHTGRITSV